MTTPLARLALALLAFLLLSAPLVGCGIEAWVETNERITLSLDLDQLMKEAKIDKAKAFPNNKVPSDLKLQFPFWHKRTYDLRNNAQIKKYKDQIRDLRVESLTYQIKQNTLSIDIPSQGKRLDVLLAKLGETQNDQFDEVGYLLPIPGGRSGLTDRLYFNDTGETQINTLLKEYALELGLRGELLIDGSQDQTVPQGKISLEITLSVKFTVDIKLE